MHTGIYRCDAMDDDPDDSDAGFCVPGSSKSVQTK